METNPEEVIQKPMLEDAIKEIIHQLEEEKAKSERAEKKEKVQIKKEPVNEKQNDFYDEDDDSFDDDFDDSYDFEPEADEEFEEPMEEEPNPQTEHQELIEAEEPNPLQEEVNPEDDSMDEPLETTEELPQDSIEETLEATEEPKMSPIEDDIVEAIDMEEEVVSETITMEEHIESSHVIVETEIITQNLEVSEPSNVFDMENLENESYDPEFEPKDEIIDGTSGVIAEDVSIETHATIENQEEESFLPALWMEQAEFDNTIDDSEMQDASQEVLNEDKKGEVHCMPEPNPYYQSKKLESKKKIYLSVLACLLFLGFAISIFFIIKAFM